MTRFFRNRRELAVCALLLLSIGAVYYPSVHHDFVNYDDQDYITENAAVQQGLTLPSLAWAFRSDWAANWHPLTWVSHMLDWQLYGPVAGGHHLSSVILHSANALLLFLLLRRVTGALWRSAVVAGLFALHPLHVESVAWASERKDVLSTLFFMLTCWSYCRYVDLKSRANAQPCVIARNAAWPRYCLTLFLFGCGLMSKPMLVTLPCVLLLLDYWPLNRLGSPAGPPASSLIFSANGFRLVAEKLPFLAFAAISSIVTFNIQRGAGVVAAVDTVPLDTRLENALWSYLAYIQKMLWPTDLAPFYPYQSSHPIGAVAAAAVVVLVISGAAVVWARRAPYLIVGWLWYLGTLVPVIGLVQVGAQAMADRYSYIPLIGLFIVVTWGLFDLAKRLGTRWPMLVPGLVPAAAAALVLCAVLAARQVRVWKDSLSLFDHAARVTTDNYLAHHSLGAALVERGELELATVHFIEAVRIKPGFAQAQSDLGLALVLQGRLEEGILHYRGAISARPNLDKPHYNLGRALAAQGKLEAAASEYLEALRLNPGYVEAREALALALVRLGQAAPAMEQLQLLLRIKPNDPALHFELAKLAKGAGKSAEAITHFETGLALKPDDAEAHESLGLLHAQAGNLAAAIGHFREGIRLQPTVQLHYELGLAYVVARDRKQAIIEYRKALELAPDWLPALNDLAWLLATDPNPDLRDGREAVHLAQKACELAGGKEARCWGTLDASLAESGRFDEAIEAARKARALALASGQSELAEAADRRLTLYASKQPFRQE